MSTLEARTARALGIMPRRLKPGGNGESINGLDVLNKPLVVNSEFFKQKLTAPKTENIFNNETNVIYLEDIKNKRLTVAESKGLENQTLLVPDTETLKQKYFPKKQLKNLLDLVRAITGVRRKSRCSGSHDMDEKCGSFRCKVRRYKRVGRPLRVVAKTPQPEKANQTTQEKPKEVATAA